MREQIHGYLSALPARFAGGALSIVAIGASLKPEKLNAWIDRMITAGEIQFWGVVGIAISLSYWLVLLLTKPLKSAPDGARNVITSTGANSTTYVGSTIYKYEEAPRNQQTLDQPVERVTKAMLKAGPQFQVGYTEKKDDIIQGHQQQFYTREACDAFAEAMEIMGVQDINKSYFDPLTRKWLPYTDRIFYTESI